MNQFATFADTPAMRGWPLCAATQQEVFGSTADAAAAAFALHLAQDEITQYRETEPSAQIQQWLWVQDRSSIRLSGRPFFHALPRALQAGLIHISAGKPKDALFAIEEGLRCSDFAFVIGELAGDPKALDFTASRRLSVASERYGVPLYLVRNDANADLSAARRRWQVVPHLSEQAKWNVRAPGSSRWRAKLFRARGIPPGEWIVSKNNEPQPCTGNASETAAPTHPVDLAAHAGDQSLAGQYAA